MKIYDFEKLYVVIFFFMLLSCKEEKKTEAITGGQGKKSGPLTVDFYVVNKSSISSDIEVPGSLLPNEETEIRSEISGRIVQLNLNEGSFAGKGQLLVKLFDSDLQAQLKKLQVQLQIAKKTSERQKELLKIGGISQQEYDLGELQVNNLNADIELVKVNISKTEIHAPYSGRLGLKNISLGAYISPSNLLATISEVNRLKLQFTVPEKYGTLIQKGQQVVFEVDGSRKTFQATVIATESAVEEATRSLTARALIRSSDPALVPGEFAKVKLVLGKDNNAIMIPSQSVMLQGRKKQVIVYNDGKANYNEIITGIRDSANVQVLSGLNLGDTLITSGLLFLRPGAEIKLAKNKVSNK
jgi:membrane fusion protein (multidrug efflux system)